MVGGGALRLGWARGPSAAALTWWGWGLALRLGQIWEVSAWENAFGKVSNIVERPHKQVPQAFWNPWMRF